MKTLLVYALAILVPATVLAQNPTSRTRYPPRKVVQPQARKAVNQPTQERVAPEVVEKNVTLHWKGSLLGAIDIDLLLTGCGPTFTVNLPPPSGAEIGEAHPGTPSPIITANATLIKTDAGYRAQHSIGARVAVKTSSHTGKDGGVSHNFEFRDIMLEGEVILTPGKPVTVSKVQGKELTLTLTEAE